jgi:hypothetical protein
LSLIQSSHDDFYSRMNDFAEISGDQNDWLISDLFDNSQITVSNGDFEHNAAPTKDNRVEKIGVLTAILLLAIVQAFLTIFVLFKLILQ